MTLAELIKTKRIQKGITQRELADELGYTSSQFISNWTRGVSKPPMFQLKKICELLDIKPEVMQEIYIADYKKQLMEAMSA